MSCEEIRRILPEWVDGRLGDRERRDLDSHLEGCAGCREEGRLLKGSWELLRGYPPVEPSPQFLAKLRSRLRPRSAWRWIAPLVSAAALLVFALLIGLRGFRDRPTEPPIAKGGRPPSTEERELAKYLDLAENYEVVTTLEMLVDRRIAAGGQILFPNEGDPK